MIELQAIQGIDCENIVTWNLDKDQDYLFQWAGHKIYAFPLTVEQIIRRLGADDTRIFKIMDNQKMIGSVELTNIDTKTGYGKICRFIIRDDYSGQGIGQYALQELVNFSVKELGLNHLELVVFTFNKRAISCYEKIGFVICKFNENQENLKWNSYTMEYNTK